MDLAIRLTDQESCRVDKYLGKTTQEEIPLQDFLGELELLSRFFKVKVHVQSADKICQRFRVLITFLFHNTDQVLELLLVGVAVAGAEAVGYDGGGEIA